MIPDLVGSTLCQHDARAADFVPTLTDPPRPIAGAVHFDPVLRPANLDAQGIQRIPYASRKGKQRGTKIRHCLARCHVGRARHEFYFDWR